MSLDTDVTEHLEGNTEEQVLNRIWEEEPFLVKYDYEFYPEANVVKFFKFFLSYYKEDDKRYLRKIDLKG